jgi:hypothetical protein
MLGNKLKLFTLMKPGIFIACYDINKVKNTVPNNPAALKLQNAEACGAQVVFFPPFCSSINIFREIFISPEIIDVFL